ncbi:phage tail spike protein [Enterococcus gallinarum]|uniref:phage tail spike protein n=1 Tax=Enterococcus gallinarum TaxID=1353 RepID=UPI0028924BA6|nr:phage tail spike protein [Enterococcus gallinarum]MDT2697486.1 phage tail spike protein [Enterococcus gallinarum]
MSLVYVYEEMPADLETNGHALIDWADLPEINRILNGDYTFYGNYSLDGQNVEYLKEDNFIRAEDEDGKMKYFEIKKVTKNLNSFSVTGRAIGYMLSRNFIESSFTQNGTGSIIMSRLKAALAFEQPFSFESDIQTVHQFTVKQTNPVDAVIGSNNGNENLASITAGELDMDNYRFRLLSRIGKDNGYRVDLGVNLESIEEEIDGNYYNSLYLIGGVPEGDYDEDKEPITYKYLELTGVTDKNRRIGKYENSELTTVEDLKKWGQSKFDVDRVHEPSITHTVSMVQLENTMEYEDLYDDIARLHFGDTCYCTVAKLGIEVAERMIEYTWYPTLGKYKSVTLGNDIEFYSNATATETAKLRQKVESRTELMVEAVRNASSWITGTKGGYVRFRPEKAPSEILIMDKPSVADAQKVWRWNLGGLGYSNSGVNGPYGLAMTQDGAIVADFITAGILSGILVQGVALKTLDDEDFQVVMEGGKLTFEKQVVSTGLDDVHGEELGRITATYGGGRVINGFAVVQDPDYIFSINSASKDNKKLSAPIFQVPEESTADNRLYNFYGKGTFGEGPITFKDNVVFEGDVEFKKGVKIAGRLDAGSIYSGGQQVYPGGSGGGVGPSGSTYEPINIGSNITGNANIVAWLEKYTKLYGISDYIGLAYALIMVENPSTDGTDDIMQSSESAGYPGPGYLTGEASVKQGCKHLAQQIKNGQDQNVDIWGVMQGYNFGSAYIPWLANRGGKNTTDLAEEYSRDVVAPSLGNTTGATYPYVNAVSQADGRTYLYVNGGNFHYAAMIRQYVKVTESVGYVVPISKPVTVTSEFGYRPHPITGAYELHNGIDLVNGNPTTPIYASAAGEVVIAGSYPEWYGNYVVIKHSDGLYTGYAHQSQLRVSVGDTVNQGQQIGNMGTTGPSTGPHLHFQFFTNGPWPSNSDFINPREHINF